MDSQLKVNSIVTLKQEARPSGFLNSFRHGGSDYLIQTIQNQADRLGVSFTSPIKLKAEVKERRDNRSVLVKFIDPFSPGCVYLSCSPYVMDDIEFGLEFDVQSNFVVGDWVYYMGGYDTDYWKPGMVGQISGTDYDCYQFNTKAGDMKMGGSNSKIYFRRATLDEVNRATSKKVEYYTDSHGNVFEKPSQIFGNPCAEITLNGPTVYTMSMFVNSGDPSKPLAAEQDETKISFKSTKLVANKINNSKEVENFLLTN